MFPGGMHFGLKGVPIYIYIYVYTYIYIYKGLQVLSINFQGRGALKFWTLAPKVVGISFLGVGLSFLRILLRI